MNSLTSKTRIGAPYRVSPLQVASKPAVDPAVLFASVLLLVTSLVRLYPPVLGLEEFSAEPTLALLVTLLTMAHLLATLRAWLTRPSGQGAAAGDCLSSSEGIMEDTAGPPATP